MRFFSNASRFACAILATSAVAACSGNSSSRLVPRTVASASSASQRLSVVLTLKEPPVRAASARRRAYVSPSTIGVVLSVADGTAKSTTAYGFDVSPKEGDSNSVCGPTDPATGTRTCPLNIVVPGGDTVDVSATLYDAVPSGNADNGHALATGSSGNVAIVANQANTISLTLSGVPAGIAAAYVGANGDSAPSFEKQAMPVVHAIDYAGNDIDTFDAMTAYAAPFTVTLADAGDDANCSGSCSGFNFARTTHTATVSAPDTALQTFSLDQTAAGKTNGSGSETQGTPPYYETLSITSGYSALSPYNGTIDVVPLFAYPSSLTLSGAGTHVTGYASQFHVPDGSAGYTIDNACAGVAGESSAQPATYGAAFTFTARTNGSCTATLGDGAGDAATLPLSVSGITTYLPAVNQAISTGGSQGVAVGSVSAKLMNPPNAGNTLLLIVSANATSPLAVPAGYTQIANVQTLSNAPGYAVFAKDVTADADQSVTIGYPSGVTGAISYYFVELQFTATNLISAVSAKNGQTAVPSSTTNALTPDAVNCLVYTAAMSSFDGYSLTGAVSDPYTATSGYAEAFVPGATGFTAAASASLDVQDLGVYTPASTTNTFSATANVSGSTSNSTNPNTTNIIFFIRPRAANS